MKKKIVLILTTALTVALSAGALAYAFNEDGYNNIVKGQNTPTTFDYDPSYLRYIENDSYEIKLRSNKNQSININLVDMQYAGRFHPLDNEFYFYNTTPIRGIHDSSISLAYDWHYDTCNVTINTLLSYNEIDLDSALRGEYKDLFFNSYSTVVDGTLNLEASIDDNPHFGEYRYFFVHIKHTGTPSYLFLDDLSMTSVCDEEPTEQDYGAGDFTDADKVKLATDYNGAFSENFTNAGNAMYVWESTYMGEGLAQYCKTGEAAPIEAKLVADGFVKQLEFNGVTYFQKQIGDVVHSIMAYYEAGKYFSKLSLSYTDTIDTFAHSTTWPGTYLNEKLSSIHQNVTPDVSSDIIDGFDYSASTTDYSCSPIVIIRIKDAIVVDEVITLVTDEMIQELMNQIIQEFIALGHWINNAPPEYGAYLNYDDNLLAAIVRINGGFINVSFNEQIPNYDPPTASQIAGALGYSDSDDIVIFNGGTGAYYSYYGVSSYYEVYNVQSGAYEAFMQALSDAGYAFNPMYNAYTKTVDLLGSTLFISFYQHSPNSYEVSCRYETNSGEDLGSLRSLMAHITHYGDDVLQQMNNIAVLPTYEYYVAHSEYTGEVYGIVVNAGQSLINNIRSNYLATYIPVYDAIAFDDSDHLVKLTLLDGGVKIEFLNYYRGDFANYVAYNAALESYLEDRGADSSNAVYFTEEDELFDSFNVSVDEACYYYGTFEEVLRVRDIFISRIPEQFVYSEYDDMYVNTTDTNHLSYSLRITNYNHYARLSIEYRFDSTYRDYVSYNDLDLDHAELLSFFPEFIADEYKNNKYFINAQIYSNQISASVKKDAPVDDYPTTLVANGFTYANGAYAKVASGYMYTFNFYPMGNEYYAVFSKVGPFKTISEFKAGLSETMLAFADSFGLSDVFASTEQVYYFRSASENSLNFYTIDETGVSSFGDYLIEHDYQSGGDNAYHKANEAGDCFQYAYIHNRGSYYDINFLLVSFSFVSWSEIETALEDAENNYDTVKNLIVFPDDGEGNLYEINYVYSTAVELEINKNYDIDAYIARIESHENFRSNKENRYFFKDGYIDIAENDTNYSIYISCDYFPGSSIEDAIEITEGSHEITLHGLVTYYAFTPEETGTYSFYTESEDWFDTYGTLFDSDGETILTTDDDSNDNGNFRFEYKLEAGKTYYVAPRLYNTSGSPRSTTFVIEKA